MLRVFRVRPRLVIAMAVGIATGLVLPDTMRVATRALLGWDVALSLWLVLVALMMTRSDNARMQTRADEDAGAAVILAFSVAAAIASLAAIVVELSAVSSHGGGPEVPGSDKAIAVSLSIATVFLSWLFVHAMFAIHYAHDFYKGEDDRRGLKFPGDEDPDYWDFVYFAFNLGAAAQTSDVAIEARRTRRLVLVQTVLAFLFNTTVLALAVNVGASLF